MIETSGIVVYTKENCPNCEKAKAILKSKCVEYTEIEIDEYNVQELSKYSRSAPVIFIDGTQLSVEDLNFI